MTIEQGLLEAAMRHVEEGNFSAYVATALREKLSHDERAAGLRAYLDRDEGERGQLESAAVARAAAELRALDG